MKRVYDIGNKQKQLNLTRFSLRKDESFLYVSPISLLFIQLNSFKEVNVCNLESI